VAGSLIASTSDRSTAIKEPLILTAPGAGFGGLIQAASGNGDTVGASAVRFVIARNQLAGLSKIWLC
jgi:hypothetical protein